MISRVMIVMTLLLATAAVSAQVMPIRLRCAYLENPRGIGDRHPQLSWALADPSHARGQGQRAYQILVASSQQKLAADEGDLWNTGRVVSDQTVGVRYGGAALQSGQPVWWKLRVWDQQDQASRWSEPAAWTMGLLGRAAWSARWITDRSYEHVLSPQAQRHSEGYHSAIQKRPDEAQWVGVDLGRPMKIGAVKLFPTRPTTLPKIDYMFPSRYRIQTAMREDFADAKTVVDQTRTQAPGPGDQLVEHRFEAHTARYVRIYVSEVRTNQFGSFFTLAEMQVFADDKNVAEGKAVLAKDALHGYAGWAPANLVDGELRSVGPARTDSAVLAIRPVPMFRRSFTIDQPVRRAVLYATALGSYRASLNGRPIGDQRLTPQWTNYGRRVLYQAYEVTDQVKVGDNAIGVLLGDGWYRMRSGWKGPQKFGGSYSGGDGVPRLLMQLEVELADGSRRVIATDESWRSHSDGPWRAALMYDGAVYDARRAMAGWDTPSFDDAQWDPVIVNASAVEPDLQAQMNQPMRVVHELKPVKMTEPKPGVYVIDFGQQIAGVCRVTVDGPAGTHVRLHYVQALNPDGTVNVHSLGRIPNVSDEIVLDGRGPQTFEPIFTYHGYRYVEVTGLPSAEAIQDIAALAISTDMPQIGAFESSDARLNRLWQNVYWTLRSNIKSVVTDNAGRDERLGWMGDGQESFQTISYLFDAAAFGAKWARDMRDYQSPNGLFSATSPPQKYHSPGWSDAGVVVPWTTWINFDHEPLAREHLAAAKRYIDALHRAHPNLLWDSDFGGSWNDWLDRTMTIAPGGEKFPMSGQATKKTPAIPHDVFSTAWWYYSTRRTADMFKAVNLTEEARQYSELADGIRGAFNKAFVGADGRIKGDVQACYAMALEMDLLDPAMQSKAMERLFEAIGRYGDHLSTGIHTTKRLLITLSRRGHHELACKLAMQPTVPSFGAMIDQDATAIWERLDAIHPRLGVNPEEMSDLNHNGFASVGQWIFGQIGGVQPDPQAPGYKQVIIAPRPGGGITWAKADYDSIRGLIACHWKLEGDQLTVDVTIPPNVAATVVIPTADIASVRESNQPIANAADVKAIAQNNDAVVVRTGSGKFSFTAVWRALHTSVKVD